MKLNSLEVKGFASYRDKVSASIPYGLTGIVGRLEGAEDRSNATGKTSLLMSLLFSLYGVGTFDRMEEVWNDKLAPSEEAYVQSNFDVEGNNYVVTRGRKNKASYLDVFENGTKVCEGNTEAQNFITDLIGMDSKMFLASVFVAQKDLAAFIETDPGVRKKYLDIVTDLTMWRSSNSRITTMRKESKAAFDTLVEEVREVEKEITEKSSLIRSLSCEVVNIKSVKQQIAEKTEEYDKKKEVEVLHITLQEYIDLREKLIEDFNSLNDRKEELDAKIKEEATAFDKLKKEYDTFVQLDVSLVENEIAELNAKLVNAMDTLVKHNKKLKGVEDKISRVSAEVSLMEKDVDNLSEGKCSTCQQDVSKEHVDKILAELSSKKIELLENIDKLEGRAKAVNCSITTVQGETAFLQEKIKEKEDSLIDHKNIIEKMEEAEQKYKESSKILVDELKNINTKVINSEIKQKEYDTKIDTLQTQIEATSGADIAFLKQELDALSRTLEDLLQKQGKLQELESNNDTQKNVLGEKKNKLKKIHENLYYFEVLGDAFKEIPSELFKESVVDIENYANEIIRSIYHKFKIKIYEDDSKKSRPLMIAFEVDGKYRNYKLLSGGQQSICALALRMGFNKILSQRSRVSLNFLILDEIFGSLDKHNREEVLRILNGLTKFFPQILVITHTEEDHIFPNLIKVRMDSRGNSYII